MPDNFPFNGRFMPSLGVYENLKRYATMKIMGEAVDDMDRLNKAITTIAIQLNLILYYDPLSLTSGCVVCSMDWMLQLANDAPMFSTDSKYDTVQGQELYWSSLISLFFEYSAPAAVWLAPREKSKDIRLALEAIGKAVPCNDPLCEHAWTVSWLGGVYRRTRKCSRKFVYPPVCTDKNYPAINAIASLHSSPHPIPSPIDPFHGYQAIEVWIGNKVFGRTHLILAFFAPSYFLIFFCYS
jgi:hypothetical protein